MTIKVNGIELEITDGASVEVLDEGKRIVVRSAGASEVHHIHHPAPLPQYQPWWGIPYGTPIVTGGLVSTEFPDTTTYSGLPNGQTISSSTYVVDNVSMENVSFTAC